MELGHWAVRSKCQQDKSASKYTDMGCWSGRDHNELVPEVRGIKIVSTNNYHLMRIECEGKNI